MTERTVNAAEPTPPELTTPELTTPELTTPELTTPHLANLVEPSLAALGLELYDVAVTGAGGRTTLRVTIDRPGGVDLQAVTTATEALGPVLDQRGRLSGPYALEVTSPGLERPLRRPEHFERARGEIVSVKERDADGRAERFRGVLLEADADGFTVDSDGAPRRVAYDAAEQVHTVFEWGPAPKPGASKKAGLT